MLYGIAVNGLTLTYKTGVERYVDKLLRAMLATPLEHDERVRLYVAKKPDGYELPAGWEWRELPFFLPKGWTHARLAWELFCNPPDVFFNPGHEVPLFVKRRTRVVSTIHDIAFQIVPGVYSAKSRRRQALAVRRAILRATRLLAVSATTAHDLVTRMHVDPAHIAVTPLGVDAASVQHAIPLVADTLQRYRLSAGRYLLFVGRLEEKKNIVTLVRAFAALKKELGVGHPLELVLAGKWGFGEQRIRDVLAVHGDGVRVLGFVPDEDLAALYAGARAFCFPSLYEGFGLPVLEAAAHGTPVVASEIPALREVMDDAALYAAPHDVAAWMAALRRVLHDATLCQTLKEKGAARVALYTWKTTAQKTWDALRSV